MIRLQLYLSAPFFPVLEEMNMTISGLLVEVKEKLSKLGNGVKCLKDNETVSKGKYNN